MGNENHQAAVIYEFWRWEYLRRNIQYQEHYNSIAAYLNKLGVVGFKQISIEKLNNKELSLLDFLETNEKFSTKYLFQIFYWLFITADKFKVVPPIHPEFGIKSEKLLKKIAVCEYKNGVVDYKIFPRAHYIPSPISSVIKIQDIAPPTPLPESIAKANERFLTQNPHFKDQIVSSLEEKRFKKRKYEINPKAPKTIVIKEKKIIIAMEDIFKNKGNCNKLETAKQNKIKQWLKNDGKRIKQKNFLRAVGLYLWDQKNQHGTIDKAVIDTFYDQLWEIEGKYNLPEIDSFLLDQGKELRKLVRNTDKCIQKKDILPII